MIAAMAMARPVYKADCPLEIGGGIDGVANPVGVEDPLGISDLAETRELERN